MSIPVHAADMAVKVPPPAPVAPYNWSGLYVGGNFGGAWTSGSLNIPGNNFYGGLTEFIGGVQVGYNFQVGNFLYGVEGRENTGRCGVRLYNTSLAGSAR